MYRGAALACPACQSPLASVRASFPALGCASCGGVWLGPEGAVHIMFGNDQAKDREIVGAAQAVAANAPVRVNPLSVGRGCPQCMAPMTPYPVGDILVDSCPAHGMWFDRDEIAPVVKITAKQRAAAERSAVKAGAAGVLDDVKTVTWGLLTQPFKALAMVAGAATACPECDAGPLQFHAPRCTYRDRYDDDPVRFGD